MGAFLRNRAGRPTARALLRGLGYSATIACASCGQSQAEQQRAQAEQEAHHAYQSCIYDAVGPFGSASIEVVNDCRQRTGYQG